MKKEPGVLGLPVTLEPELANAALRTAPEFEQEYWLRQARAAIHRDVLAQEGIVVQTPNAMSRGESINGGVYEKWLPVAGAGAFATDPVSGDCGTFEYDLIHLDCGVF